MECVCGILGEKQYGTVTKKEHITICTKKWEN